MSLSCSGLLGVKNYFLNLEGSTFSAIQDLQVPVRARCGVGCDATTAEFYDYLQSYMDLHVQEFLVEILPMRQKNFLVKMYGMSNLLAIQYQLMFIPCDYACFIREAPGALYVDLAVNYVSRAAVDLIDLYVAHGFVDCPSWNASAAAWSTDSAMCPVGQAGAGDGHAYPLDPWVGLAVEAPPGWGQEGR